MKTFEVEMKFNIGNSNLTMDDIDDKLFMLAMGMLLSVIMGKVQ